eukprot:CAMPEP_0185789888 /NCGR_PEP_ID=MMETSP1174-20130828/153318_1 /TAXON_ID=35687 /ORGANISM="Dictyocha speculum, Strain CCMP1381" /LENGTH=106 /DNA_ID=CAMNT_0028484243 /DNA_START=8 /DNA_END=325 /DNA_ORIENTATION=-
MTSPLAVDRIPIFFPAPANTSEEVQQVGRSQDTTRPVASSTPPPLPPRRSSNSNSTTGMLTAGNARYACETGTAGGESSIDEGSSATDIKNVAAVSRRSSTSVGNK